MGSDHKDIAKPEGAAVESLPRTARDAIDLNNEIAGRDTGRAKRFLSTDPQTAVSEKEREKDRAFNALMRALQDPEYARLHEEVKDKLGREENAAEKALDRLERESAIAADELHKIEDAAAQLPDGRRVYRSEKDGKLYTEDGTDVTDQEQSVTGLTSASPSLERHERARERLDDLERRRQDVERYQREYLNPIRDRINDPDNPYSQDELQEIAEEFGANRPPDVSAEIGPEVSASAAPVKGSAADEYLGEFDLAVPDMSSHFATAKSQEPYGSSPEAPLPATSPKFS